MTLGGFALAVGILVDDATVEIENINRNLAQGKEITQAILDGAQQIAVPAFVSTLAISIVFVSVVFLDGAARYLFTPMALAVGIAVMSSYFLSRTVVPTPVASTSSPCMRPEPMAGTPASDDPSARVHGAPSSSRISAPAATS